MIIIDVFLSLLDALTLSNPYLFHGIIILAIFPFLLSLNTLWHLHIHIKKLLKTSNKKEFIRDLLKDKLRFISTGISFIFLLIPFIVVSFQPISLERYKFLILFKEHPCVVKAMEAPRMDNLFYATKIHHCVAEEYRLHIIEELKKAKDENRKSILKAKEFLLNNEPSESVFNSIELEEL